MIFGHLSLHVDRIGAPRNEEHTMKGTVTLRCDHPRLPNRQDTWQADFEVDFTHSPSVLLESVLRQTVLTSTMISLPMRAIAGSRC